MRQLLLEATAVAIAGAVAAFAANAVSPRGLKLSRNYFPAAPAAKAEHSVTNVPSAASSNVLTGTEAIIERLRLKGLKYLKTKEAVERFRDPAYQLGTILFIDARDDQHYTEGHIPGAYQLDYYHPENYLPLVLPLTQVASQIIVYCNGGDCEDSEFTALFLRDAGVSLEKLSIYLGGFSEWKTNNLPVEIGQRMSGTVTNAN